MTVQPYTDSEEPTMIVTVTPTIMSGTVVRWYHDASPLDSLPGIEPVASASRDGIRVGVFLHDVPAKVMQAAENVHEALRRDPDADMNHLATHRKRGGLFGSYERIGQVACKCPRELCRCDHAAQTITVPRVWPDLPTIPTYIQPEGVECPSDQPWICTRADCPGCFNVHCWASNPHACPNGCDVKPRSGTAPR